MSTILIGHSPVPLPKTNPVIHTGGFFARRFLNGDTHLIKMPKFLSTFREDLALLSILMVFFLSLYLLLAAVLITRLQGDYLTGSGIPSACNPPSVGLSGTPRPKLSVPQSLCT
jgi:hypothetical protein